MASTTSSANNRAYWASMSNRSVFGTRVGK